MSLQIIVRNEICVLYKKQLCARMYRMLYIWIFASKLNLLHVSPITNTQLRAQQTFHIFDVFPDVVSQWTAMTIRPSCPTQPTPEARKWETQGRFCFNLLDSVLKTVKCLADQEIKETYRATYWESDPT